MKIHNLAMAVGKIWFGGFAPVFCAGAQPRTTAAAKPVLGDGMPLRTVPGLLNVLDVFNSVGRAAQNEEPMTFRAVVATAKSEVAQARMKRDAERRDMYLPPRKAAVAERSFAPIRLNAIKGEAEILARVQMADTPAWVPQGTGRDAAAPVLRGGRCVHDTIPDVPRLWSQQQGTDGEAFAETPARLASESPRFDIGQALEEYFFQQSRLPPSGTTAFDPRLTPTWAGLKLPG